MISRTYPNFPLESPSKKGNPKSHYWPKKSEQDAVRGDFFGIRLDIMGTPWNSNTSQEKDLRGKKALRPCATDVLEPKISHFPLKLAPTLESW